MDKVVQREALGRLLPAAPRWFVELVRPYCNKMTLPMLAEHVHVVILAAIFYHSIYFLSAYISPRVSASYRKLDRRTRTNWDIHSVSQIQSAVILSLSWQVLTRDWALAEDKISGYSAFGGDVYACACGYFVWDILISLYWVRWYGWAFVFHGAMSLQVFGCCFRPFLMWYGPAFLAFEASTLFLNIHWWLDKIDMTGSLLQTINGGILLLTFFLVRGVWGWYMAYDVFSNLWRHRHQVSQTLSLMYLFSNMSLNLLNIYWFSQMTKALRKRMGGNKKNTASAGAKKVK